MIDVPRKHSTDSIVESAKKAIEAEKRKQFVAVIGGKPYNNLFLQQLETFNSKDK